MFSHQDYVSTAPSPQYHTRLAGLVLVMRFLSVQQLSLLILETSFLSIQFPRPPSVHVGLPITAPCFLYSGCLWRRVRVFREVGPITVEY